jgi:hypothetical protein
MYARQLHQTVEQGIVMQQVLAQALSQVASLARGIGLQWHVHVTHFLIFKVGSFKN